MNGKDLTHKTNLNGSQVRDLAQALPNEISGINDSKIKMDDNCIYLFSEDLFANQNRFIQDIHTTKQLVKVENFKLICFIKRLDYRRYPFVTTPIESHGEYCYLYQYHYSNI